MSNFETDKNKQEDIAAPGTKTEQNSEKNEETLRAEIKQEGGNNSLDRGNKKICRPGPP